MPEEKTVIELEGINKTFPAVRALDNVSLSVKSGEVRGLVGENGAGKSTLIKIITGAYTKDSGTMIFEGNEITRNSPLISKALGIYAVYQDVMVTPDLSVAENFFLGQQPKIGPFINWKKMYKESTEFLENIGLDINVRKSIKELSIAESEMITISKALWQKPKLVIFDEPTAVLTRNETKILFQIIDELMGRAPSPAPTPR
ncbi:MAG: ATP-binding cassette domain-containing protein [Mesotoga sp.]|nr:ATP-binding cassette domain-containing protein [Mesotoga sp.]